MIAHLPFSLSAATLGIVCACAALGCRDLASFDSKPGQAYCGAIIGLFQGGFVKENQPPNLELGLVFHVDQLTSRPGELSSNDAVDGMCAAPGAPRRLFDAVPLRAIPEVDHDVLSSLTFGEGHVHDFFAWVDSSCQGTMLAVVSLMKNDQIELRLFKPARVPQPGATPFDVPGFAVFHLQAQAQSDCQVYK